MSESSANAIGDRITYCRSSLILTRKELIDEWFGASLPTLVRWELGKVKIPAKKIPSLVQYFHNKGLLVSENWILNGSGAPPILMRENSFDEPDFDSLAQEDLLNLNKKINNFIFGQVRNNLMSPFIKYGDYIGGKNLSTDLLVSFKGDIIFVKLTTGLVTGILEECEPKIILMNFGKIITEPYKQDLIESIGKIQWIIRRP